MTSITTTRPLPLDAVTLRDHWLPQEPTGTRVAQQRHGVRRLDAMRDTVRNDLAALDTEEQQLIDRLAALVARDGDIGATLEQLANVDRTSLVRRLEQLERARGTAVYKLGVAETSDPKFTGWQAVCRQITDDWERTVNTDDPDVSRYERAVRWAQRHEGRTAEASPASSTPILDAVMAERTHD